MLCRTHQSNCPCLGETYTSGGGDLCCCYISICNEHSQNEVPVFLRALQSLITTSVARSVQCYIYRKGNQLWKRSWGWAGTAVEAFWHLFKCYVSFDRTYPNNPKRCKTGDFEGERPLGKSTSGVHQRAAQVKGRGFGFSFPILYYVGQYSSHNGAQLSGLLKRSL